MEEFKEYLKQIIPEISSIYEKSYSVNNTVFNITLTGGMSKFLDSFIMENDQYTIEIKNQNNFKCSFDITN